MVRMRGVVGVFGVVAATLLLGAVPAMAHVEVSVEPAQAGATDAVVSFTAEAESDTAGVNMMQVQLPEGINPGDVTLRSGPPGWALTPTNDGYTVSGPPLAPGAEVQYAVKVKQLPNAPTVAFKTLQSYTDGTTDRWIELQAPGGPEPANPAPVATLAGAAPAEPPSSASSSTAPAPETSAPTENNQDNQADPAAPADDGGMPAGVWWGIAALAAVIAVVAVVLVRRRARGTADSTADESGDDRA